MLQGDIAVLCIDLNDAIEDVGGNSDFLSIEEHRRAREYTQDHDRIRFIRRRVILRRLLGEILNRHPKDIAIHTTASGKPFLDHDALIGSLTFSLSCSQNRAIYAITRGRAVGIDLEWMDPTVDCAGMAGVFCRPGEIEQLGKITDEQRLRAFYDCWCSKEAFIKAAGIRDPRSFSVSFWPEHPGLCKKGVRTSTDLTGQTPFIGPERPDLKEEDKTTDQWSFCRLDIGNDWSAMLVAERTGQKYGGLNCRLSTPSRSNGRNE